MLLYGVSTTGTGGGGGEVSFFREDFSKTEGKNEIWSHTTEGYLRVLYAKGVALTHREQRACKTVLASLHSIAMLLKLPT